MKLTFAMMIAAATMFVPAATLPAASYAPAIGEPHPDFVLPNIDSGEPVSLSQYRGKRVLLIHFASW